MYSPKENVFKRLLISVKFRMSGLVKVTVLVSSESCTGRSILFTTLVGNGEVKSSISDTVPEVFVQEEISLFASDIKDT